VTGKVTAAASTIGVHRSPTGGRSGDALSAAGRLYTTQTLTCRRGNMFFPSSGQGFDFAHNKVQPHESIGSLIFRDGPITK